MIPFADGSASVGVVGEPSVLRASGASEAERLEHLCATSPSHRELLGGARATQPFERRAGFSYVCEHVVGARFLLCGDAAGFIDPLFSTGVFLAQKGAFLAADALAPALREDRPMTSEEQRAYADTLGRITRRFLSLVRISYEQDFIDIAVRKRQRPVRRRAFTSLLAGDVLDEDNPLLRMGIVTAG